MATIARVDRATGLVVNLEVAEQDWIDANANDPEFEFVAYEADTPALIGAQYDSVLGMFTEPLAE